MKESTKDYIVTIALMVWMILWVIYLAIRAMDAISNKPPKYIIEQVAEPVYQGDYQVYADIDSLYLFHNQRRVATLPWHSLLLTKAIIKDNY